MTEWTSNVSTNRTHSWKADPNGEDIRLTQSTTATSLTLLDFDTELVHAFRLVILFRVTVLSQQENGQILRSTNNMLSLCSNRMKWLKQTLGIMLTQPSEVLMITFSRVKSVRRERLLVDTKQSMVNWKHLDVFDNSFATIIMNTSTTSILQPSLLN